MPEQFSHLDPQSLSSLSALKPDKGAKDQELIIPPALELSKEENEPLTNLLIKARQANEEGDTKSRDNLLRQYQKEYSQLRTQKEEEQRQKDEQERLEKERTAKEEREKKFQELLGEPSETLQKLEKELNLNIREQYLEQIDLLTRTGLVETLSSGNLGFIGLAWQEETDPHSGETNLMQIEKEYLVPTIEQVTLKFLKSIERMGTETLKTKISQGFSKLLFTPFAKPINDFINSQKQIILSKFKEGEKQFDSSGAYQYSQPHPDSQLLSTNPDGSTIQLDLNINEPLYQWDQYANSDTSGKMIYYPQQFTSNLDEDSQPVHQGKTKQQLLQQQLKEDDPCLGWDLKLIEEGEIPQEGANQIKNNRKRLEANQKPNQYLETLQNPESDLNKNPYYQEQGLTPEDEISHFITYLEKTNQVIDDYKGQGKACYLVGSYLAGGVPNCYWDRVYRQLSLDGGGPGYRVGDFGARSSVML